MMLNRSHGMLAREALHGGRTHSLAFGALNLRRGKGGALTSTCVAATRLRLLVREARNSRNRPGEPLSRPRLTALGLIEARLV